MEDERTHVGTLEGLEELEGFEGPSAQWHLRSNDCSRHHDGWDASQVRRRADAYGARTKACLLLVHSNEALTRCSLVGKRGMGNSNGLKLNVETPHQQS